MKGWLETLRLDHNRLPSGLSAINTRAPAIVICILFVFWMKCIKLILNPQFWAEDSVVFFNDAFYEGLSSIFKPIAGYYVVIMRIVAVIATIPAIKLAPLTSLLCTILLQLSPLYLIYSNRTSRIFNNDILRHSFALLYLAGPAAFEVFGNVTNVQWYLPVWIFIFFFADPAEKASVRWVEYLFLFLICMTGPFVIFLLPIYFGLVFVRAVRLNFIIVGLMTVCFVAQGYSIYNTPQTSVDSMQFGILAKYASSKFILNGLLGAVEQRMIFNGVPSKAAVAIGLIIWCYSTLRIALHGSFFLRVLLVFANLIFVAGYRKMGALFTMDPEVGARYAWLAVTTYLFTYIYIATHSRLAFERLFFATLFLTTILLAIPQDLLQSNARNENWQRNVSPFRWLNTGDTLRVPVDPAPWSLDLVKDTPSDIQDFKANDVLTSTLCIRLENQTFKIRDGWAFINNESATYNQVFIVLRSEQNFYVIPTSTQIRPEVSATFHNNYDQSGFTASKNIAHVKDDNYSVGIFLYNDRTRHYGLKYVASSLVISQAGLKTETTDLCF